LSVGISVGDGVQDGRGVGVLVGRIIFVGERLGTRVGGIDVSVGLGVPITGGVVVAVSVPKKIGVGNGSQ
jgi:hypothetical protein